MARQTTGAQRQLLRRIATAARAAAKKQESATSAYAARDKLILQALAEGISQQAIADEAGVERAYIYKVRRKARKAEEASA